SADGLLPARREAIDIPGWRASRRRRQAGFVQRIPAYPSDRHGAWRGAASASARAGGGALAGRGRRGRGGRGRVVRPRVGRWVGGWLAAGWEVGTEASENINAPESLDAALPSSLPASGTGAPAPPCASTFDLIQEKTRSTLAKVSIWPVEELTATILCGDEPGT